MMMAERGRTIQFWRVADRRSDVVIPLRSARSSVELLGVGTISTREREKEEKLTVD
jgi:hypothetical protein